MTSVKAPDEMIAEPGVGEEGPSAMPLRALSPAEHGIRTTDVDVHAGRVLRRLREAGFLAYIAGGAVRDLLLGRTPKDFDVVTDARPEQIRRLFRNSRMIGRRFRIVHILYGREFVEVSTFRSRVDPDEAAARHERHVFRMQDGLVLRDNVYGTPKEDAWRRDFSVNALFYNFADETVLDYVGGIEDLRAGRLRVLGDAERRLVEDPVRMIRAVRFAASLGFELDDRARESVRACAGRLSSASPARLYEEIQKIFFCGSAVRVLDALVEYRLLDVLFPDMVGWIREEPDRIAWLRRVSRQLDIWRQAGHSVPPELFLALFCGPFHEAQAEAGQTADELSAQAYEQAAVKHLRRLSERISVPRFAAYHAARILAAQPRFRAIPPRRHSRFMTSAIFRDAYIYFKLRARFQGAHSEALAWWEAALGQGRGPETSDDDDTERTPDEPPRDPPREPTPRDAHESGRAADTPQAGELQGGTYRQERKNT